MSSEPEQVIDLTETGDTLRYVEILTPAGIVRVNVNLVDVRTLAPVVAVEVEPNTSWQRKTRSGGHWVTETRDHGHRLDVLLARSAEGGGRD